MDLPGREKTASCSPPAKRWFLDWQFDHYQRELLTGVPIHHHHSHQHQLLDNCDLPPPLKLSSPLQIEDDPKKPTAINPIASIPPPIAPEKARDWDDELGSNQGGENPSLRRALQLSQTRAREAEKKASALERRKEEMTDLMLEESMRLFAYRQWMKLLEVEVSLLKTEEKKKRSTPEMREEEEQEEAAVPASPWWVALALCVGIAGVGFVLGRFMF